MEKEEVGLKKRPKSDQNDSSLEVNLESSRKNDNSDDEIEQDPFFDNLYLQSVDDVYDKIRGNNRFTWFYAIPIGLVYVLTPVYVIPYMKQIPSLQCSYNSGTTWSSCTKEDVCSNQLNLTYRYDYNSISTVDNWISKMDLVCLSDFKIGLMGTLFFLGWVIGAATLLSLGDIFGRKKMLIISVIGILLMMLCLIVVDKLFLLYLSLLLLGLFQGSKGALAYLYMLELAPLQLRPALHMFAMTSEAVMEIFGSLLVWWFQNGFFIILVLMAANVGLLMAVLFSPESPKFLHTARRWEELHSILKYISHFNGAEEWNGKFDEEVHSEHHNQSELGFFEILKVPSFRCNLLLMAINWSCCSFCFYIIGYSMNKFKGNVYVNGLIFGCADITGTLLSVILMLKFKFK